MILRRGRSAAARPADEPPRAVGILGAGRMGTLHALAAGVAGLRVVEVASRTPESAARLAEACGAEVVAGPGSFRRAGVVVVCTPTERHTEDVRALLAAGRDVLVEVPGAMRAEELEVLAAAAAGSERLVRVAEHLAHSPVVRAALTRRSALGPARHLLVRTRDTRVATRHHAVWLAFMLAGEPCTGGVRERTFTRLEFASGLTAMIEHGGDHWDAELACEDGVVRLELSPEVRLEVNGEAVPIRLRHEGTDPRLEQLGYVTQLAEVCASGVPPERVPGLPLEGAAEVLRHL